MSCIKLVQNSQELASSLRPYSTLNYIYIYIYIHERKFGDDIVTLCQSVRMFFHDFVTPPIRVPISKRSKLANVYVSAMQDQNEHFGAPI